MLQPFFTASLFAAAATAALGFVISADVAFSAVPVGCVEIRASRLLDTKTMRYRQPAVIRVKDGKIIPTDSPPPQVCETVELRDATLMPGLIDAHTHLFARDRSYFSDFSQELLRIVSEPDKTRRNWATESAKQFALEGITSVRDLGNSGKLLDIAFRRSLGAGATYIGPRLFLSGPGISPAEGQFPPGSARAVVKKEYLPVLDASSAKKAVKLLHKGGVEWVKVFTDGDPNPGVLSQELLDVIVMEARKHGKKIAAHSTTAESAHRAAKSRVDSIEHGYELSQPTLSLMAKNRTFLVPTDFSRKLCDIIRKHNPDPLYKDPTAYIEKRGKRLRHALDAGVRIAFGSDVYADLGKEGLDMGKAAKEALYAYVDGGLSPTEALRSGTIWGAELLGMEGMLGVLENGAFADIIAVRGDPLADIRALDSILFVMKEGAVLKQP